MRKTHQNALIRPRRDNRVASPSPQHPLLLLLLGIRSQNTLNDPTGGGMRGDCDASDCAYMVVGGGVDNKIVIGGDIRSDDYYRFSRIGFLF